LRRKRRWHRWWWRINFRELQRKWNFYLKFESYVECLTNLTKRMEFGAIMIAIQNFNNMII